MTEVSTFTVWIDYGLDGWKPFDCDTVAECLDTIAGYGIGGGYRITRPVHLTTTEDADA